ncbi:MAG: response regulator, partial [Alphaproteobacteria bacterium]
MTLDPAILQRRLERERQARKQAEALLEQKAAELFEANRQLETYAERLAQTVQSTRDDAESWRNEAAQARSHLVRAERRLWGAIEAMRDGFALFDPDNRLVVANSAYKAVFRHRAEELEPGIRYMDIACILAEEGLVDLEGMTPAQFVADMMARFGDSERPPRILRFVNGQYVKLFDRRTPDGDVVTLGVNITSMMRMQAAVDALEDGFVLFDREERFVFANRRYAEMYPATAHLHVPGTPLADILREAAREGQIFGNCHHADIDRCVAERMAQHRAGGSFEQQLADGRWVKVIEQPTPDGGRVGLRIDITEIKAREAQLIEARAEAEAASRAKSAFLANMSHEIRTPMNGVVGMAELLCETELSGEQRLFAETIRASGEALLTIINDVLDYSKIEAGKLELFSEPFDLERLIHDSLMLLKPKAAQKGLDLVLDYDLFLPTRLVGDAGRVRQCLLNLLGNAVKFTEAGHVMVRTTGITRDGVLELHLTVEDTGIGIPPEKLDHVFGEFNQVDDAANRKFEGTGLGLAITRRLIELMGGRIWVESTPGEGSVFGFAVSLPVAEDAGAQAGGHTHPATTPRTGPGPRLVLVDDMPVNRTVIERHLRGLGARVKSFADPVRALDHITGRKHPPDAVLTDQRMPGMSGEALAVRLRETGFSGPVILLSSDGTASRENAGAITATLHKPVLRRELAELLGGLAGAPGQAGAQGDAALAGEPASPPEPAAQAEAPLRVLLAEDNRTNQLVFRKMVGDAPVALVIANDGEEAVAAWQAHRPDLVFMDVSMPGLDGIEATRRIRALEAEAGLAATPIIALTAHAMTGDRERFLAEGMSGYLTKPVRKALIH